MIVESCGLDKSKAIMIGDRPDTDILFGKNAGIDTCLVMTGVTEGEEDFKKNWVYAVESSAYIPTHFLESFGSW